MSAKSNLAASLALPENEPVARVFSQSTELIALIRSTPLEAPEIPGSMKLILQMPVFSASLQIRLLKFFLGCELVARTR